jgi:hypothetical protein
MEVMENFWQLAQTTDCRETCQMKLQIPTLLYDEDEGIQPGQDCAD